MEGDIRVFKFCVVVTLSAWCLSIEAATLQQTNDLAAKLYRGYNKNTLPILDQEAGFNVVAVIDLLVISDVNDVQELLSTVMVLHMMWTDESMVWNKSEHHNITSITMEASEMWKPHLAVTNMHNSRKNTEDTDWHLIQYLNTGLAEWSTKKSLDTSCDMDTTYYPFDIQVCSVELYIYGYNMKIQFSPMFFDEIHLQAYKPHSTWSIKDYHVVNPDGPNITVTYTLERNPKYMVINFLVPLFVLALLNPLVFLLPPDSGERTGYSISIMLALSVFLTQLGYYLPQNSDPIPLITYTLMIWYILSACSMILIVVSARLFNKPELKPIPKLLQLLVKFKRRLFCNDCKSQRSRSQYKCDENINEENEVLRKETLSAPDDQLRGDLKPITWQDVSRSFDCVFIVFMYFVKLTFALVFMFLLSTRSAQIHDHK